MVQNKIEILTAFSNAVLMKPEHKGSDDGGILWSWGEQ